jgi:hypothetical protein
MNQYGCHYHMWNNKFDTDFFTVLFVLYFNNILSTVGWVEATQTPTSCVLRWGSLSLTPTYGLNAAINIKRAGEALSGAIYQPEKVAA